MIKFKIFLIIIISCVFNLNLYASSNIKLIKVSSVKLDDFSAIKRGARIFFDYCQGCHSLKYMRYSDLATGIHISGNKSYNELIREYFLHSTDSINENSPILSSISKEYGVKWFGKVPPDLSLIIKYRGVDWLYTYMQSFYKDRSRPFGVNNLVFPDVAMPHALVKLQGIQVLKENHHKYSDIENMLQLVENGILSRDNYNLVVKDLVTFLSYISEPNAVIRNAIGIFVVGYFIILAVLLYFIKRSYWKDIK
ncbi:MAG TPA: cytochrome c1 [Candidatus Azoamicus sp. OHIO2]